LDVFDPKMFLKEYSKYQSKSHTSAEEAY